jgi:hypothetical protein
MRRAALIVVVLMALDGSAAARSPVGASNAPPGNSGVDQYLETVPDAGGGRPAGSGGASHQTPLATTTQRALRDLGADGRAVQRLAETTAPAAKPSGPKPNGPPSMPGTHVDEPRGPVAAVVEHAVANSDSGGLGIALPVLLALTAIGAPVFVLLRHRRA